MSLRYVALIALALTTASLAGCIGGEDPDANRSTATRERGTTSRPGMASVNGNLTSITFPADRATNRTVWANGTFSPQQNCYAGGCLTGSAFQQAELDEEIPSGIPTTIRVQLTYESGPAVLDEPLDLGVFAEEASFYSYESTEESGRDVVETTVLKEGSPIVVQVFYEWPTGSEPEAQYTLRIDVDAEAKVLPPGVPVEVPGQPGQRFTAAAAVPAGSAGQGSGSPGLLVYGPDDTLLDRWTSEGGSLDETLPAGAPSGDYVLVAPETGPPIRLKTNASGAKLRPLALTFEGGDAHPVRGPQPVSWSFDTSTVPLAVGVYMTNDLPAGVSADEGSVTVEGPSGTLLDGPFGCGTCFTLGYGTGTATLLGASGLAAGTYSATYEPTGEVGFAVGHFVIGYER